MRKAFLFFVVCTQLSSAFAYNEYPMAPNASLTPGELCDRPSTYRYPEHIAYCERDVDETLKEQIFESYRQLGFRLTGNRRSSYKVDHYIPLCAGGSNNRENLWPQHISVGQHTDFLEDLGCKKMAEGKLLQADFIKLIKRAKNNIEEAPAVRGQLDRL